MELIKISDFICNESKEIIKKSLENDLIDFEQIKEHIVNCKFCSDNIKKGITKVSSPIGIMNFNE